MRLYKKYKGWVTLSSNEIPKRILNFKRSKWQFVKKKIRLITKTFSIYNFLHEVLIFNRWERLNISFKNSLLLRRNFNYKYQNTVRGARLPTIWLREKALLFHFLKLEFRLDILLFRLKFFNSMFAAEMFLRGNNILYNGKTIKSSNIFLRKGDVITFIKFPYTFNFKNITNQILFSFIEIDFYNLTITILKDFNDLSTDYLSLVLHDSYSISCFNEIKI